MTKTYAKTLALIAAVAASLVMTTPVIADGCTTQYGGYGSNCPPTDLSITKEVKNPTTSNFVKNLGITDAAYSAGTKVVYKLSVTNSSGETFKDVVIKDILPENLTFVAGPGTFDEKTRTLTFHETNMIAGETRKTEIVAQIATTEKLPKQNFFCFTNKATATAQGRYDEDTADACVQKTISGKTELPVAGFEDMAMLIPFATLGFTGIGMLLKKSK